jgi:hypothetical protein
VGGFSTVTPPPSQVSATNIAQTVWSYSPRSLTDIQSLVTAIQSNNPSLLSSLSDILYVPAPFFAGQVSATQVAAFLDNLVLNYGLAGPAAAAISASPYGLWSTNFVTQAIPYLSATALNLLLSSGQMDANHAQLILYWLAQNYYYNRWIYTITANAPSSITFSANTVLNQNVLIAQNITIASGVTVTCGTTTCFFIAQSFNNQGTVVAYGAAGGGVSGTSEAVGGTAGGGAVIIAVTAALGTINVAGLPGGNLTAGVAYSGDTGFGGIFYILSGMTVPVGGTGAGPYGEPGKSNGGGAGGTGLAGGFGGNATVYSFSSPNAMVTYILQGLSYWWLINVLAKMPSSTTPLTFMYGSGGGGSWRGGGGGGGGGEVVVYGYDIVSGNINAGGGVGGSAPYTAGGGGGGGGLVFVLYGATSGSVTANVAGGAGQSGGGAGASGTAYIAAVTVNG